jgi:hypothetical protein
MVVGFASAVWPEEGKDFACLDGKRNVFNRGKVAEFLDQVLHFDHGYTHQKIAILNGLV